MFRSHYTSNTFNTSLVLKKTWIEMDTRDCCSGCAGVNNVYYCSNPISRASTLQPVTVKKEEVTTPGITAVAPTPRAVVTVKKEEKVKV